MSFDIRSFIKEVSDPEEEESIEKEPKEKASPLTIEEKTIAHIVEVQTIASLLQKNEESRVERYLRLSKNLTKKERRCLEQQLLKPEGIPPFVGHRATHTSVDDRSVKIIFESDEDFELFRRFFRVNSYKGQNTRDVDIIVALVEALDRGSLEYNATDKTLDFIADNGERIPL